jgi:uncharacterized protein YyaL (SSP411 family)
VLEGVDTAWREQRAELEQAGARLVGQLAAQARNTAGPAPQPDQLDTAVTLIERSFDARNGGWGGAPKFPQPMTIEFLLRRAVAAGDERALATARASLDAMAAGGIHDQLGGGFHRYSTDAKWLVPHFEQMLYDNAQLARAYAHALALTGEPAYRDTVVGVLDYLLRELRTHDGGFAASQDADTEGEEGATFVWSAAELREVLGEAGLDPALFSAAYGVTDAGNWEGSTILSRVRGDAELAERFGQSPDDVAATLAAARAVLANRRAGRAQPARDDKVLAGWNGLAIAAFADAARVLAARGEGERADRYRDAAVAAAEAVLRGLITADGRLRRSWKDGRASADGVLEDHANLADGLLALYEATHDERWYGEATRLCDLILERFADPAGGFFDTADDAEALVVRPKDVQDNATPSGNAMATTALLRLAALSGEGRYRTAAERALATVGPLLLRYPTGFAQWLCALEFAHAGVSEVALVGSPEDRALRDLVRVVDRDYRPFVVLAATGDPSRTAVPLLRDRFALGGRATAFVCRDFACRQPVHEPEALDALLAGG